MLTKPAILNDIEKNNPSNHYDFSHNIFAGTTAVYKSPTGGTANSYKIELKKILHHAPGLFNLFSYPNVDLQKGK